MARGTQSGTSGMDHARPGEVLDFWIDDVGPKGWYATDADLDREIRERFMTAWVAAGDGRLARWRETTEGTLAFLIVTDQFGRNMFREDPRAFALDPLARAVAKAAVDAGEDLAIHGPQRQFFYLPLMHSETLADQDRCIRLFAARMPEAEENLLHARAHRAVIRDFGRFPHRNAALGRPSRAAERTFLDAGGYGAVVRALRSAE